MNNRNHFSTIRGNPISYRDIAEQKGGHYPPNYNGLLWESYAFKEMQKADDFAKGWNSVPIPKSK